MLETCSVAMAVYNGEMYLNQQLDSILGQLQENDELLISYDESDDGTFELITRYSKLDNRIKIIKNTCPGVVGNFNNAIAASSKDVVFVSDQDDIWMPGKRNEIIGVLNRTQSDLVIHNVVHVDNEGEIISKPLFEEYGIRKGSFRNFVAPRYSGCCMAFPASSKRMIMPMPLSVINYDHWIGMACELFGQVYFDDRVFLKHRLHGGNLTTPRRKLKTVCSQRAKLLCELIKRKRELSR